MLKFLVLFGLLTFESNALCDKKNEIEGGGGENSNKICGKTDVSEDMYDDETALFFELDLFESYDELEKLAKVHPEQAMKLLMFAREHKDSEESITNLKHSQYTSPLMPSFEFYQLARNDELGKLHTEKGIDAIENTSTRLDSGSVLLVESWSSLLPDGNIEIRTRSVVADVILPEVGLKPTEILPGVELKPTELLAETVATIEPVKNEKHLYRILSLEW